MHAKKEKKIKTPLEGLTCQKQNKIKYLTKTKKQTVAHRNEVFN